MQVGGWLDVVSVHAPPGINWQGGHAVGPEQRIRSYGSLMEKLLGHVRDTQGPMVVGGDWNEGAATGGRFSPSWFATHARLTKHADGGIDWEMSRGATVTDVRRGPSGGSDHRPVLFTVTRPEKK